MNNLTSYAFKKVVCLVGGVPITGFDEGDDVIQINRNVDSVSFVVGAGGDAVATITSDRSALLILRLQSTSPSNKILSGLLNVMEAGGFIPFPILVKDSGTLLDLHAAPKCIVSRPPPTNLGMGHNPREWTIFCGDMTMIHGGS